MASRSGSPRVARSASSFGMMLAALAAETAKKTEVIMEMARIVII